MVAEDTWTQSQYCKNKLIYGVVNMTMTFRHLWTLKPAGRSHQKRDFYSVSAKIRDVQKNAERDCFVVTL